MNDDGHFEVEAIRDLKHTARSSLTLAKRPQSFSRPVNTQSGTYVFDEQLQGYIPEQCAQGDLGFFNNTDDPVFVTKTSVMTEKIRGMTTMDLLDQIQGTRAMLADPNLDSQQHSEWVEYLRLLIAERKRRLAGAKQRLKKYTDKWMDDEDADEISHDKP